MEGFKSLWTPDPPWIVDKASQIWAIKSDQDREIGAEGEGQALVRSSQGLFEGLPLDEVHREEGKRAIGARVVDADNVGVFETSEEAEFPVEACELVFRGTNRVDSLESADVTVVAVLDFEDSGSSPGAEGVDHAVAIGNQPFRGHGEIDDLCDGCVS